MINNFKQIRDLLRFENEHDYYFIQVIKSRKDNPRLNIDSKFIKEYYVFSLDEFDKLKDDLICTCELAHARAYIWLNVRNSDSTALHMIRRLSELIGYGNTRSALCLCRKVSTEQHTDKNPKIIIDVDNDNDLIFAKSVIADLWKGKSGGYVIAEIQTPNGIHLITTQFDTDRFMQSCPSIKVSRDRATVLYHPVAITTD